ncbi:serum amyloid A protein-like [Patagioenas fasciata monilis]|uniref:Serum amyloid A protein-like n=2 Tax=Patagioenas fasciata TaxID=372321 RepID=A0A1V4JNQ7_PATFA|nr:serum amyloid A protein-like [Patagioenas fasciata monilis]
MLLPPWLLHLTSSVYTACEYSTALAKCQCWPLKRKPAGFPGFELLINTLSESESTQDKLHLLWLWPSAVLCVRLEPGTMRVCVCLVLLSLILCASADIPGRRFVVDAIGGAKDMYRAYRDMREANYKGADKYFHARGNYDAAQRGPGGAWAAKVISDARELWQSGVSGRGAEDTRADQEANRWGRSGGDPNRYRPKGLPNKY